MSTLDEKRGQSQARGGQRWPEAASRTRGTMLFAAFAGLCVFSFFISAMQLKDVNTRTSWEQELSKQQHFIVEQTHQSEQMGQCLGLDLDDGMDNLLDKYKQVILVMPAKAAGSTYKQFTDNCMKSAGTSGGAFGQLDAPSLSAGHIHTWQKIISVLEHSTKDTLVIYSHREETSRFSSAVKHVFWRHCGKPRPPFKEGPPCQISENNLLEKIKNRQDEIGVGPRRVLRCQTFESIQENAPNLAFVNYKQANKLQKLLSKHHCPNFTDTLKSNTGDQKPSMSVVLEGSKVNGTIVSIDDWLKAKGGILEYEAKARSGWSCQAKMKDIEAELFACPDEALQISGRSYENQNVTFPLQ